jgi:hypothetical protein
MTLLSTQDIADKLGIPYQAAQKRLWRAGIKPYRVIGRNNLYAASVLDQLNPGGAQK